MTTTTKYERIARLHAVGDDDAVDPELRTIRREPDKRRIVTDTDQRPAIDLEAVLVAEVERTRERYDAACLDLRRWRMSHGHDERPAVDMLAVLQAEVERTRERYEAACLDLRRWRMSHGNDSRP